MSFPRYPEYKDSGVEWLGEVPSHWTVVELKHIADVSTGMAKGKDHAGRDTIGVPYLRVANVQNGYLDLEDVALMEIPVADLARYSLKPGDVLMNEGGDFDKLGRGCVWNGQIDPCITQNHVFAVRPRSVRSEWLSAITGSAYAQFYFKTRAKQSTNLASISSTNLMELPVVIPPPDEQTVIAAFLGRETAKIDALVAEQQRLIELLDEKRQVTISHAVTNGLNPDAPRKDSGVEWLGEVPAHWRVVPLGKVTVSRCDGPFGSGLKSEHYTDCGVRVIRLQNIRRDGFDGADEAFIDADYYERELRGHDVVAGDVLIAGLGDDNNTVGRACVAPRGIEPAMVKADCFRFRLDREQATPEFVATALCAGAAADAGVLSSGSTRSRIPLSVMATRKLALPPVDEQEEITAYLGAAVLKFDTLITEAQRAIDLLQERRAALISASVTGQIDVRAIADRAAA